MPARQRGPLANITAHFREFDRTKLAQGKSVRGVITLFALFGTEDEATAPKTVLAIFTRRLHP